MEELFETVSDKLSVALKNRAVRCDMESGGVALEALRAGGVPRALP